MLLVMCKKKTEMLNCFVSGRGGFVCQYDFKFNLDDSLLDDNNSSSRLYYKSLPDDNGASVRTSYFGVRQSGTEQRRGVTPVNNMDGQ